MVDSRLSYLSESVDMMSLHESLIIYLQFDLFISIYNIFDILGHYTIHLYIQLYGSISRIFIIVLKYERSNISFRILSRINSNIQENLNLTNIFDVLLFINFYFNLSSHLEKQYGIKCIVVHNCIILISNL